MSKNISIGFILALLLSCSSSKIYKKIEKITESHNRTASREVVFTKGFNLTKIIFKNLNESIGSDSIIYLFSWNNHLPDNSTKDFMALVFDKENHKTYNIYNDYEEYRKISIKDTSDNFYEEQYLLDLYLKGEIDTIKEFENQFSSSEIGTNYYLFDVPLNKVTIIEPVFFDEDGTPIKF